MRNYIISTLNQEAINGSLTSNDIRELILRSDLAVDAFVPLEIKSVDICMLFAAKMILDQLDELTEKNIAMSEDVLKFKEKLRDNVTRAINLTVSSNNPKEVWLKRKFFTELLQPLERTEELNSDEVNSIKKSLENLPLSANLRVKLFHDRAQIFVKTDEQYIDRCVSILKGKKPTAFLGSHISLSDGLSGSRSLEVANLLIEKYGSMETVADKDGKGKDITTHTLNKVVDFSIHGIYRYYPVTNGRFFYADCLQIDSECVEDIKHDCNLHHPQGLLPLQWVNDEYVPNNYRLHITVNEENRKPEADLKAYLCTESGEKWIAEFTSTIEGTTKQDQNDKLLSTLFVSPQSAHFVADSSSYTNKPF